MSINKGQLHVQVPVPSYYICPISLEIMRDPVTLTTGQTFDRSSIEKWLDDGNTTCPVTRQPISLQEMDADLIPNHVLRRMIKSWIEQNHSLIGIDRLISPRQPPPTLRDIPRLLEHVSHRQLGSSDALQSLIKLAADRPRSRRVMLTHGALGHLGRALSRTSSGPLARAASVAATATESQSLLRLADLLTSDGSHSSEDLALALSVTIAKSASSPDSRHTAIQILSRLQLTDSLRRRVGDTPGFMEAIVEVMISPPKTSTVFTAAESVLLELSRNCNKNRVRAVEAGAVEALALILSRTDCKQRRNFIKLEMGIRALDAICQCAEGREAALSVEGTMEAVMRTMSGVSEMASHYAVHVAWLVVKSAPDSAASLIKRMAVSHGGLVKAVAVAQSAATAETRAAARNLATHFLHLLPAEDIPHTVRL